MRRYKTYCKTIPKKFNKVHSSSYNKPYGGLWGCRGDEWKEWCEREQFNLHKLKKCFQWRLKRGSKVFYLKSEKDFAFLADNYANVLTIDYEKMSNDYDAIEVVGNIVYKLHFSCNYKRSLPKPANMEEYLMYITDSDMVVDMALNAWDVPSICVLNPDKIVMLGEI